MCLCVCLYMYYMASQIIEANNQIQVADRLKMGPIASHIKLGSYWTDFSLTHMRSVLFYDLKLKPCNKYLNNLVCSVSPGKCLPSVFRTDRADSEKPRANIYSRTDLALATWTF